MSANCPKRCSLHKSVAAAALAVYLLVSVPCGAFANDPTQQRATQSSLLLPALSNTEESDRELLREVADAHVFEPEPDLVPTTTILIYQPDPIAASGSEVWPTPAEALPPSSAADPKTSVWDRLRDSEPMELSVTSAVEAQKRQYLQDALWTNRLLQRAQPFLHFIVQQLHERSMPLGLALIPAVESGFQPTANSSGSAAGLWQIVPITASEIGLKRSMWFDERSDLRESTRAALDYLSYLNAEFHGDWELTLAAYNAGPGRVKAAMRRNEKNDEPTDFWSLDLPAETEAYVPRITALLALVRAEPSSPLDLPKIPNEPVFDVVEVGHRISLDHAARLAEVDEAELRALNAGLIHGVTAPSGRHELLLPVHTIPSFRRNLAAEDDNKLYSLPRIHVVQAGDTLSGIARNYGMSQRQLRELNNIDGSKILVGQKLAVMDTRHTDTGTKREGVLSYTIRKGDTLSEIAERFQVRMVDIIDSTGSSAKGSLLIPGRTLRIPLPVTDEKG